MPGHFTLGKTKNFIGYSLYHYMEEKEKVIISDSGLNEIYLITQKDYQTIYCSQSKLRILIYPVDEAIDRGYEFYAYIEGNLMGFITENMASFEEFYQALEWYSKYISQPFFKLLREKPVLKA